MGKNQAYKAMQRAKMSSHAGGVLDDVEDGMMDGSFHSPEWHAARLASLQTSHTITWEEYKKRQKEEAKRKNELEDGEAKLMREYRAQLDAERAFKLSRGRNHTGKKDKSKRVKKEKNKEKDKRSSKKKKSEKRHRKSESDTDDSSSSADDASPKKDRRKSKKERKHKKRKKDSDTSASSSSSGSDQENHGPIPLSSFFENGRV